MNSNLFMREEIHYYSSFIYFSSITKISNDYELNETEERREKLDFNTMRMKKSPRL